MKIKFDIIIILSSLIKVNGESWLSLWGSYIDGIFSGVGTLIAIITTSQAMNHQKENMKKVQKVFKLNLSQSKIANANETIKDLSEKLNIMDKLMKEIDDFMKQNFSVSDYLGQDKANNLHSLTVSMSGEFSNYTTNISISL